MSTARQLRVYGRNIKGSSAIAIELKSQPHSIIIESDAVYQIGAYLILIFLNIFYLTYDIFCIFT